MRSACYNALLCVAMQQGTVRQVTQKLLMLELVIKGLRPKKIDYLFSVERPLFKKMCAFTFFMRNMPHIVFLLRKVRKMNSKLLNDSKESVNHAFFLLKNKV